MVILLWDASGLVKRYYAETGLETVTEIFNHVPRSRMQFTIWGYAETFAILHRKRNGGLIANNAFVRAISKLQDEVVSSDGFGLINIGDEQVLAGLAYVLKHNLNLNDAAILATYLRYQNSLPPGSPPCLLVTADLRLVRASEAEGLATLNPERFSSTDVAAVVRGTT